MLTKNLLPPKERRSPNRKSQIKILPFRQEETSWLISFRCSGQDKTNWFQSIVALLSIVDKIFRLICVRLTGRKQYRINCLKINGLANPLA